MEAERNNVVDEGEGFEMRRKRNVEDEEDWIVVIGDTLDTFVDNAARKRDRGARGCGVDKNEPEQGEMAVALLAQSALVEKNSRDLSLVASTTLASTVQTNKANLKDVLDCIEQLESLRNEKESCRVEFENRLQSVLDQARATQSTVTELDVLQSDRTSVFGVLQTQLVKDLECQMHMDRQAFSERAKALRWAAQMLRSFESDISAQEGHLLEYLRQTTADNPGGNIGR